MKDVSNELTEKELRKLENRIRRVYTEASKDIQHEMDVFLKAFKEEDKAFREAIKNGTKTDAQYRKWLEEKIFEGEEWQNKAESMANTLYKYNQAATNLVNGTLPGVFQINTNYAAFELEKKAGVSFSFSIYNEHAIHEILVKNARILPSKKLKKGKDIAWNYKAIKNEVAKGIMNGNSVDKIARRLSKVIPNRNLTQLTTHARTMVTSAQNQGRMYRMHEAEDKGIEVKKKWVATLDNRTRYGHAELDGQIKDIDEPFEAEGYEIMEPGDPTAHPSLVYNCRCRIETVLGKYPNTYTQRRDNETGELIKDMNYKEWYKMKTGEDW
jgi:uncharacterized protein with gpF-like domain